MDLTKKEKQIRLQELIFRAKEVKLNNGEKREFAVLLGTDMRPCKPKLKVVPNL